MNIAGIKGSPHQAGRMNLLNMTNTTLTHGDTTPPAIALPQPAPAANKKLHSSSEKTQHSQ